MCVTCDYVWLCRKYCYDSSSGVLNWADFPGMLSFKVSATNAFSNGCTSDQVIISFNSTKSYKSVCNTKSFPTIRQLVQPCAYAYKLQEQLFQVSLTLSAKCACAFQQSCLNAIIGDQHISYCYNEENGAIEDYERRFIGVAHVSYTGQANDAVQIDWSTPAATRWTSLPDSSCPH